MLTRAYTGLRGVRRNGNIWADDVFFYYSGVHLDCNQVIITSSNQMEFGVV